MAMIRLRILRFSSSRREGIKIAGASIGAAHFAKMRPANSIKNAEIIGEFYAFLRL
jgi:hypothetical protein